MILNGNIIERCSRTLVPKCVCKCVHVYIVYIELLDIHTHAHTLALSLSLSKLQMYEKIKSSKVSYGLAAKAEQAKKLVQVGGLSEASAEGESRKIKIRRSKKLPIAGLATCTYGQKDQELLCSVG